MMEKSLHARTCARKGNIAMQDHSSRLLFQFKGTPPLGTSASLALQHLVAMIVGCVTPPIIIAGAVGLSQADRVLLIQASLVMSAVSTLLQLFPIGGRFGSGLPVILGVSLHMCPVCRPSQPPAEGLPPLPERCWWAALWR